MAAEVVKKLMGAAPSPSVFTTIIKVVIGGAAATGLVYESLYNGEQVFSECGRQLSGPSVAPAGASQRTRAQFRALLTHALCLPHMLVPSPHALGQLRVVIAQ